MPNKAKKKDKRGKRIANELTFKNKYSKSELKGSLCHQLGKNIRCNTEDRGFATPNNSNPAALAVHVSQGFIPLWEPNQVLRWQFNEQSMSIFVSPDAAKDYFRELFREAVLAWGDAAPIRFTEVSSGWDFEVVMSHTDDCDASGACTTGMAFFPDAGRHRMYYYPRTFDQIPKEQLDTFIHEIGHVFGLRHFFANLENVPYEVFGHEHPFSIMNYGELSELTQTDKSDLKKLYEHVWNGKLRDINGTPIKLFKPFHVGI